MTCSKEGIRQLIASTWSRSTPFIFPKYRSCHDSWAARGSTRSMSGKELGLLGSPPGLEQCARDHAGLVLRTLTIPFACYWLTGSSKWVRYLAHGPEAKKYFESKRKFAKAQPETVRLSQVYMHQLLTSNVEIGFSATVSGACRQYHLNLYGVKDIPQQSSEKK